MAEDHPSVDLDTHLSSPRESEESAPKKNRQFYRKKVCRF